MMFGTVGIFYIVTILSSSLQQRCSCCHLPDTGSGNLLGSLILEFQVGSQWLPERTEWNEYFTEFISESWKHCTVEKVAKDIHEIYLLVRLGNGTKGFLQIGEWRERCHTTTRYMLWQDYISRIMTYTSGVLSFVKIDIRPVIPLRLSYNSLTYWSLELDILKALCRHMRFGNLLVEASLLEAWTCSLPSACQVCHCRPVSTKQNF